jgi:hypothetical protein
MLQTENVLSSSNFFTFDLFGRFPVRISVVMIILRYQESSWRVKGGRSVGEQLEHDDGIRDKCSDRPPNCMGKEGRSC